MAKHGVYSSEIESTVIAPIVAESGIPFVIGTAPVQSADSPASAGEVVLCNTYEEAVEKLGYSDDWSKFTLCEFMFAHFKLYGCSPVIFCNLLDVTNSSHKESVAASDYNVTDHKAKISSDAINDSDLVVIDDEDTLTKDVDYKVFYDSTDCVIELLSTGSAYSATSLNIAYKKVKPSAVAAADVATGIEKIELCLTTLGVVPDIICAPGYSQTSTVAAVMATKAESINGLFKAKAIVDIDTTVATTPANAVAKKGTDMLTEESEVVCWPMAKFGDKIFHMSTLIAGTIATVDTANNGCPYESPSNKAIKATALCLSDGSEVQLTFTNANVLNAGGIVTAINFINGWVVWGNYTGCYPASTQAKDYFIPVSRMFGWIGNTLIKTFWSRLDKPMNRRLIDTILDTANIWLNGLTGQGYLLGARVEMLDSENPIENLMAGIIKLHVYATPPSPAQEIDFVLEYDSSYVESALQA